MAARKGSKKEQALADLLAGNAVAREQFQTVVDASVKQAMAAVQVEELEEEVPVPARTIAKPKRQVNPYPKLIAQVFEGTEGFQVSEEIDLGKLPPKGQLTGKVGPARSAPNEGEESHFVTGPVAGLNAPYIRAIIGGWEKLADHLGIEL